jgi:hypothetical protein
LKVQPLGLIVDPHLHGLRRFGEGPVIPMENEVSLTDRAIADASAPWVFFDRGLIDAAAALEHLTGEPIVKNLDSGNAQQAA